MREEMRVLISSPTHAHRAPHPPPLLLVSSNHLCGCSHPAYPRDNKAPFLPPPSCSSSHRQPNPTHPSGKVDESGHARCHHTPTPACPPPRRHPWGGGPVLFCTYPFSPSPSPSFTHTYTQHTHIVRSPLSALTASPVRSASSAGCTHTRTHQTPCVECVGKLYGSVPHGTVILPRSSSDCLAGVSRATKTGCQTLYLTPDATSPFSPTVALPRTSLVPPSALFMRHSIPTRRIMIA